MIHNEKTESDGRRYMRWLASIGAGMTAYILLVTSVPGYLAGWVVAVSSVTLGFSVVLITNVLAPKAPVDGPTDAV